MSRQLVSIVAAAFATGFLCVSVSSADEMKVGFVNTQEFISKSVRAQAQRKKLLELYQVKKSALEKRAKELQGLKNEMSGQYQALEKEAKNERVKQMALKRTEFKLSEQEAKNTVRNEDRDVTNTLQQDVVKIVHKIRQDKKLGVVFNSSALLSADEKLNLTEEVARAYDAEASPGSKSGAAGK
jgi:Skp family chaperone for outer membrane proteins